MNATVEQPSTWTDVAICGGGPVGLALAFLLGRAGVRVQLFEKRSGTTSLPKGQYVHASTAELYRQWGVWDLLKDAGWSLSRSNGQGFYVNISKGPIAEVRSATGSDAEYEAKWQELSPVFPRKIPAADYEAALRKQAMQWAGVKLNFDCQVEEVSEGIEHAQLAVRENPTGARKIVSARFVVACDGAHSFIRNRLGQGEDQGPTFGNQILTEFRAPLEELLGHDGFFHSFVLDPRYAGWFGSQHPQTGLWRYSFRHDEETPPHPDLVLQRIRGALGRSDIPIEIVRSHRFEYTTGLIRGWRRGAIFFAGDAAHWHSPWGGYGANSGVQDANNLAWKLALVVKGLAPDSLLDTYEVERTPRALLTVKAATYNALNFQSIIAAATVGENQIASSGELTETAVDLLRVWVESQGVSSVLHTGYQLGTVYQSSAIVGEPSPAPRATLGDYVESTAPGVRAPHAWLQNPNGRRISTVDLFGDHFTLVVQKDGSKWKEAADKICSSLGIRIKVVHVGVGGDLEAAQPKFNLLYSQVVLVRPDGFVACRWADAVPIGATEELLKALNRILGWELAGANLLEAGDTAFSGGARSSALRPSVVPA